MTIKKATTQLKENVVGGYRSTVGGLLMIGLCVWYFVIYDKYFYYCVGGAFTGIGLIVFPDQIVPLIMEVFKAFFSRIIGLIGGKK